MAFKHTLIALLCLAFLSWGNATKPTNPDDIKGYWYTSNREAVVEIYSRGDVYYGRIISLAKPLDKKGNPKTDRRNKDPELRDRPLIGLNTVYDLKYDASKKHWEGKVYIPLTGMEVEAIITLKDVSTMIIHGSKGGLKKSQTWERFK